MAALWGNPNLDNADKPRLREDLAKAVDLQYSKAIAMLYGEITPEDEEVDWDNDFLAPAKAAMDKMKLPSLNDE